jgi:4-methylaminobutanoate oxidase (formaldehyde-forming)
LPHALPEHAEIVVVGSGIIGCSVLYHLAKARVPVLLEPHQIESRITWHPAVLVTATGGQQGRHDAMWMRGHIGEGDNALITDVTPGYAVLAITGPRSRGLLSRAGSADLSNTTLAVGTSQEIEVGLGLVWALPVSYAGEFGWELYVPTDLAEHVFETIIEASVGFNLRLGGAAALASLRLENGFRSWGHDIGPTDTPVKAGLMFGIRQKKACPLSVR